MFWLRSVLNMDWVLFMLIFEGVLGVVLSDDLVVGNSESYAIEGKVFPPDAFATGPLGNWQINTRILANGGEFLGFLKSDGSFVINNVPSGSYVIEAVNPDYAYEPVRVEINSKGKIRARKVNHIQVSQVIQMPYPLKMKALTKFRYFHVREQWRVTDFLFSPMVLMMMLPLVLIMILPKLMNDPETRKEMEQINNSMKYEVPEVSDLVMSLLSGSDKQKAKAVKTAKKKQ